MRGLLGAVWLTREKERERESSEKVCLSLQTPSSMAIREADQKQLQHGNVAWSLLLDLDFPTRATLIVMISKISESLTEEASNSNSTDVLPFTIQRPWQWQLGLSSCAGWWR
jgi:hypothetical protein